MIHVDGCCNKHGSFASVVDTNGRDLIDKYSSYFDDFDFLCWFDLVEHRGKKVYSVSFSDVTSQQNNGAELLAAVLGVLIALEYNYSTVCSDSSLIVDHWSRKKSDKIKDKRKKKIQHLLVDLVKVFEKRGGELVKISGDDNLADLGYHRKKK